MCDVYTRSRHDGGPACPGGCNFEHVDLTAAEHIAREGAIAQYRKDQELMKGKAGEKAGKGKGRGKGGKGGKKGSEGRGQALAVWTTGDHVYADDNVGGNAPGGSEKGGNRTAAAAASPVPEGVYLPAPPSSPEGYEYQAHQRKKNEQAWRKAALNP